MPAVDVAVRNALETLKLEYVPFPENRAFAVVDCEGHQVVVQVRPCPRGEDNPWALDDVVYVGTILLADVAAPNPLAWMGTMHLNAHLPFGKLYFDEEERRLGVAVELFATDLTVRQLALALDFVSHTAIGLGDQMAEHFEGRRVFWKHGRRSW